jgi:hypothetical protein
MKGEEDLEVKEETQLAVKEEEAFQSWVELRSMVHASNPFATSIKSTA